jgi:BirA family biotin operon repressor/biotin-[acetyl-CoA-carboxylase] ligase
VPLFDPVAFETALGRVAWVTRVVAVAHTGSTNDDALALAADGAPGGTVVVADVQTAGRGRLGRSWWSEPGTTLTASWVMRPDDPPERWTLVPLACGVASALALRSLTGLDVTLKWPNDVVIGDRKLAGILVEARPPEFAVAGIGVNLSCAIPPDLAGIATSVAIQGAAVPERPALLAAILEELDAVLRSGEVVERYRELCSTIGREVRVERAGATDVVGRATDVAANGALLVSTATEGVVEVAAGDVVHARSRG